MEAEFGQDTGDHRVTAVGPEPQTIACNGGCGLHEVSRDVRIDHGELTADGRVRPFEPRVADQRTVDSSEQMAVADTVAVPDMQHRVLRQGPHAVDVRDVIDQRENLVDLDWVEARAGFDLWFWHSATLVGRARVNSGRAVGCAG